MRTVSCIWQSLFIFVIVFSSVRWFFPPPIGFLLFWERREFYHPCWVLSSALFSAALVQFSFIRRLFSREACGVEPVPWGNEFFNRSLASFLKIKMWWLAEKHMYINDTSVFWHSVPLCFLVPVLLYRLKLFFVLGFCLFVVVNTTVSIQLRTVQLSSTHAMWVISYSVSWILTVRTLFLTMLLARMTWLLEQKISLQSWQLVCWCLK